MRIKSGDGPATAPPRWIGGPGLTTSSGPAFAFGLAVVLTTRRDRHCVGPQLGDGLSWTIPRRPTASCS